MAIASLELPRRGHLQLVDGDVQVLAAEPLNLRNQSARDKLSGVLLHDRVYGRNAWKWYSRIGEIHFALNRAARIAGYAKISAVRRSPTGEIVDTVDTGPAADAIQGVYSRIGGTRGLIERYFTHMKVPAESHLIRWMDGRTQDGYQFVSSKELADGQDVSGLEIQENPKYQLKVTTSPLGGGKGNAFVKTLANKDYLGRVWMPSGEWLDVPESPLNSLDRQCDMLDSMTRMMQANLKSRFLVGGILYFSNKVREAVGGKQKGKPVESVLQVMYRIMKENLELSEDTDDISSILPILMMGDALPSEVAEHITVDRAILETDLKLRSELIDRILFGLDINVQATRGNEDTSHWGAWQNSADELRLAVMPDLDAFTWTIDRLILTPALLDAKDSKQRAGEIGVGYELDEASVKANRAEDGRQMVDRGLLQGIPALKASGFRAEDLLTGAEYIRWMGVKLRIPKLAAYGTPEYDLIDWTDPAITPTKTGRIADSEGDGPESGPGVGDPGSPDDSDDDTPKADKPI